MAEWLTILISIGGSFILAAVGALEGASVYRRQARIDLEKELAALQQRERRDVYGNFIQLLQAITRKDATPKNIEKGFSEFTFKSLLLSSDSVFRAFPAFTKHSVDDTDRTEGQARVMLNSMATLIRAIRIEMGYPDTSLSDREILSAFINDIETVWPSDGQPENAPVGE